MQRHLRRSLVYAIPFIACLIVYARSLAFDLTFDDVYHMSGPGTPEGRTFLQVWREPTLFYRPAVVATFWAEGKLGLDLWMRHGLNVLLHGLVTVLVVRFARSLGIGAWWACLAGCLFAVHPVHVEAVAGFVGRADMMAAVWLLLALWMHDTVLRQPGGVASRFPVKVCLLTGAFSLAFLAAGSKESAWLLPLFVAALHVVRQRRAMGVTWPMWVGYAGGMGALLLLRQEALGGWLRPPGRVILPFDNPLTTLDGLDRLLGGLRVVGLNLQHLVFPLELAPDYSGSHFDLTGGIGDWRLGAGIVLVVGTVAGIAWGLHRMNRSEGKVLFFSGLILITSAMVVMNLVFDLETVLGDRLLYWPSVAWVLIVASVGMSIAERSAPRRRAGGVVAAAAILFLGSGYAVRAAGYLPSWKNDYTLFSRGAQVAPEVPRVWYNLGLAQRKRGETARALASFQKARKLATNYKEAWTEEAVALMSLGRWGEAHAPLEEALRLDGRDSNALANLGALLLHEERTGEAARILRLILDVDPRHADALYNLGLAEEKAGHFEAAMKAWERYLTERPDDPRILNHAAWLLATELHRPEEAEALARRSLAADPRATYYDTLAETLFRQGRVEEAVDAARAAVGLEDSPHYRKRLMDFSGTHGAEGDSGTSP